MITPAYFCIEDFNGEAPTPPTPPQDEPPYVVNPVEDVVFENYPETLSIDLNGVATDPDDPDENIIYSIVSNSNPDELEAQLNGTLLRLARRSLNQAEADLVMRATSDGQYIDFTIHVTMNPCEGIHENMLEISVFPNPCEGQLHLVMDNGGLFEYQVFNQMGQRVTTGQSNGPETVVDLSQCPNGVYFISVVQNGKRQMKKVVVI